MQCISKFEQGSNHPPENCGVHSNRVAFCIKQTMKDRSRVNETGADQMKARCSWDGPAGGCVSPELDSAIRGALGAGRPLDHSVCRQLDIGGRHDLDHVRVHTDSRADDLSRALGARAFTVGKDIFFSEGSWEPDSDTGRGLIAHELAHVAQQEAGRVPTGKGRLVVRPANDAFEWDADRAAASVTSSGPLDVPAASTLHPRRSHPSLTIQRSAVTFAGHAGTAPVAAGPHGYTCHMSALYWAFRDAGDTAAVAGTRIEAIATNKCHGCVAVAQGRPAAMHVSIPNPWYGTNLCSAADPVVANRAALANTAVGDVLWVGDHRSPAHSMVLVGKLNLPNATQVYIRGFNNIGTLGTGPHNQYDPQDRNIDKDQYWHTQGGNTRFGMNYLNDRVLHRIAFATFSARAAVVRGNCNILNGVCTYVGP